MLLVSFRTTLGLEHFGWKKEKWHFLFFSLNCLHFSETLNDLSEAMIRGIMIDGFVLLWFSIFHSLQRYHSLFLFLEESHYFPQPAHFNQIHPITPRLVTAKKIPYWRSKNFISLPVQYFFLLLLLFWLFLFMLWNYSVILFFRLHPICEGMAVAAVNEIYFWLNLCIDISREMANWLLRFTISDGFKLNCNCSSVLDHQLSSNTLVLKKK